MTDDFVATHCTTTTTTSEGRLVQLGLKRLDTLLGGDIREIVRLWKLLLMLRG